MPRAIVAPRLRDALLCCIALRARTVGSADELRDGSSSSGASDGIVKRPAREAVLSETHSGQGNFLVIGDFGDPFHPGKDDGLSDCWGPHWKCPAKCGFPAVGADDPHCKIHTLPYEQDEFGQVHVAQYMAEWAEKNNAQFVVNVGDSFYPAGVDGVDDPMWAYVYEDRYSNESLQVPWLSTNGNHDWGGFSCYFDKEKGRLARGYFQVDYDTEPEWQWPAAKRSRWVMPDLWYQKRIFFGNVTMDFFFVDTNFWDAHDGPLACGQGSIRIPPACEGQSFTDCKSWCAESTRKQWQWLKGVLPKSDATWKFVVGHHPFVAFAGTWQGGAGSLASFLVLNNVSMYMCGHTHAMEGKWFKENEDGPGHTKATDRAVYQMLNGAGGGSFPDAGMFWRWGFTGIKVNGSMPLQISFVSDSGKSWDEVIEVPHPCVQYWAGACKWSAGTWGDCVNDARTRQVWCVAGAAELCANTEQPALTEACEAGLPKGLVVTGVAALALVAAVAGSAVFFILRKRRTLARDALLRREAQEA